MAKRSPDRLHGTLNVRGIPRSLLHRMKIAAAVEHRTVKGFLLAVIEARLRELEHEGLLPKGK